MASAVSYDYGGTTGFQSALTNDQWNQLYAYQLAFGVRMVQYDVYPGPLYGSTALGVLIDAGGWRVLTTNQADVVPPASSN